MARRLDPAELAANELGESRAHLERHVQCASLPGLACERPACVEGWDKSAPASAGLPVEHGYRLRGPGGNRAYVTEPRALNAIEIGALADLSARGWRVTVEAAGALCLPGETLHIVIRPRPVFGGRRRGVLRAVTERDPRAAAPTRLPDR
jgi:hypothetical protein